MDTNALKRFAQGARNLLIDQVSARLDMVLTEGAAARREHPKAIAKLETAAGRNRQQVIEQAAYTWFNRFTALRFMDVTGLTNPRVVSPADGATRPEILAGAMAGNLPDRVRPEIAEYLNGMRPARDGQAEAYRLLLIHACNEWHGVMPYMFERADMLDRAEDYTELLMPDDLLSPDSILARLREVMTEEACQDVEIIGWLYQFYISEKKDQVFAGLKKNQKITAENIPAATQLFTPHWIVRYLVENSLGRLWLLNRPKSKLAAKMDYYIAPEESETDFLKISRPEDIRICDPACGSGHMLTYAFDLLYDIYAEEGHDATDIPSLILRHNLTGIEIDDRAGALAAFALSMKAAAKLGRRRFLRMESKPDIVVLQDVSFTSAEMQDVAAVVGEDLFTDELRETLGQFEHAKNFGSLIVPKLRDADETLRMVKARNFGSDLLLKEVQERVVVVLRMAEALSPRYCVVVANPPYAGASNLNPKLKNFLGKVFPNGKSDLMAGFVQRTDILTLAGGFSASVTLDSWMFLASYQAFRADLFDAGSISSLVHVGWNCFPDGHTYNRGVAFVLEKGVRNLAGRFMNLSDVEATVDKHRFFKEKRTEENYFDTKTEAFEVLPGKPIAYWMSTHFHRAFEKFPSLGELAEFRIGMATGKNDLYVRLWQEVSIESCEFLSDSREASKASGRKWFPYAKGGPFRRWAGNREHLVNWENDGHLLQTVKHPSGDRIWAHNFNLGSIFKPSVCWTQVTDAGSSFRYYPNGYLFDAAAGMGQPKSGTDIEIMLGVLNSTFSEVAQSFLNPTRNILPGTLSAIPTASVAVKDTVAKAVQLAEADWDAYETSWDFTALPLLAPDRRAETLSASYNRLRAHWQDMTDEMQRLEKQNNRIFIDAYELQDELTPEVPIEEITLTCNPAYRYGVKGTKQERETRLREDTMAEFLHYAVGCMLGRYSLDEPGLILANQGEGIEEYLDRVPEPTFSPNADNVIPVLDADWFADDIVTRAHEFLRVTFGKEHFRENLAFIETALGKDLRKWFTKDFYDYHVRRYKKRPIYWMFSSPKGSFNALIYMHRYRPDTVSVVLNQYLREFIHKLEIERARLEKLADDPSATQSARTRAQKDVGTVIKQITELTEWERDVVYPMAQQKITIDLDDGVKHNYPLFTGALKPIKGLEAADD
ncbi:type II restriction endonuclease [Acetobacter malorum]|uniref:site-specific DNA-methyltransferase (adenine-specific) n=2 Tax=Acetobacter malorum TaxID=178901 RepID=A0A149RLX8_9PROT|nr:BREX-1 system adenine-specific DNA-methyltransferase PglX [Acetobacter malorum]KXV15201.1 type II restriction endonuclease [Acetobacter malorum]